MIGEDRELVSFAIAIGILTDFNAVVPHAVLAHAVRVVAGLCDPAAAAFVPCQGNRFGDVRLAREELQLKVRGHLGAFHAAFHIQRLLKG